MKPDLKGHLPPSQIKRPKALSPPKTSIHLINSPPSSPLPLPSPPFSPSSALKETHPTPPPTPSDLPHTLRLRYPHTKGGPFSSRGHFGNQILHKAIAGNRLETAEGNGRVSGHDVFPLCLSSKACANPQSREGPQGEGQRRRLKGAGAGKERRGQGPDGGGGRRRRGGGGSGVGQRRAVGNGEA